MTLIEIAKQPGVSDIRPATARGLFAKAIKLEMEGDTDKAVEYLDKAVDAAS